MSEEKRGQVVDLASFRQKRSIENDRQPGVLYVNHQTGKITGAPRAAPDPEFGERLQRIRASMEKINRLMREIKEMSNQPPPANWPGPSIKVLGALISLKKNLPRLLIKPTQPHCQPFIWEQVCFRVRLLPMQK